MYIFINLFETKLPLRADFSNSFFDYVDGLEGNYVKGLPRLTYGAHKSEHRGLAYDRDGTITGKMWKIQK